jgi:ERCC4-related helicase
MNDKRHQKTSDERENLEDEIRKTRAYMDHLLEAILEQACKMGLEAERRDRLHRARSYRFRDQFEELIAEYAENKMKIRALRAKQAMIGLPQQP